MWLEKHAQLLDANHVGTRRLANVDFFANPKYIAAVKSSGSFHVRNGTVPAKRRLYRGKFSSSGWSSRVGHYSQFRNGNHGVFNEDAVWVIRVALDPLERATKLLKTLAIRLVLLASPEEVNRFPSEVGEFTGGDRIGDFSEKGDRHAANVACLL